MADGSSKWKTVAAGASRLWQVLADGGRRRPVLADGGSRWQTVVAGASKQWQTATIDGSWWRLAVANCGKWWVVDVS